MAIVTSRDYQLNSSPLAALLQGIRTGEEIRNLPKERELREIALEKARLQGVQAQRDEEQAQRMEQLRGLFGGAERDESGALVGETDIMTQARQIDPILAEDFLKANGLDTATQREEASRFAGSIIDLPMNQQDAAIARRIEELTRMGRNPSNTAELLQMTPEQRYQALMSVQLADLSTKERLAQMRGAGATAGQRDFEALTEGFSPEEIKLARRIKAGLAPRAGLSAEERIVQDQNISDSIKEFRGLTAQEVSIRKVLGSERAKTIAGVRKFAGKFESLKKKSDRLIRQSEEAIKNVNAWTGGPGSLLSAVRGTPQRDAAELIKTIEANIGFDRLQEMRDSSPTGGALGQVAVEELRQLQRSIASLDLGQRPERIRENLKVVIDTYKDYVNATQIAYEEDLRVSREGFRQEMSEDFEYGRKGEEKNIEKDASKRIRFDNKGNVIQ